LKKNKGVWEKKRGPSKNTSAVSWKVVNAQTKTNPTEKKQRAKVGKWGGEGWNGGSPIHATGKARGGRGTG